MTTLLFSLALVVLTVALILMSMTVKRLSEEIDEFDDPDYDRVCAEELVELLNQEQ